MGGVKERTRGQLPLCSLALAFSLFQLPPRMKNFDGDKVPSGKYTCQSATY